MHKLSLLKQSESNTMTSNGFNENVFHSILRLDRLLPNNTSFKHHILCCVEGAETIVLLPHPCSALVANSVNVHFPSSIDVGN